MNTTTRLTRATHRGSINPYTQFTPGDPVVVIDNHTREWIEGTVTAVHTDRIRPHITVQTTDNDGHTETRDFHREFRTLHKTTDTLDERVFVVSIAEHVDAERRAAKTIAAAAERVDLRARLAARGLFAGPAMSLSSLRVTAEALG